MAVSRRRLCWTTLLHLALIGLFVFMICRITVGWAVYRVDQYRAAAGGTENCTARLAEEGPGFNPDNLYWVVEYDCQECDVEIRGVIPRTLCWSLVPYDRTTMPLRSYLTDGTIRTDDRGRYVAILTTKPRGRLNEVDVGASPRGYVLIRSSFAENPKQVAGEMPEVRPLPVE